jgi:hypothetical protein
MFPLPDAAAPVHSYVAVFFGLRPVSGCRDGDRFSRIDVIGRGHAGQHRRGQRTAAHCRTPRRSAAEDKARGQAKGIDVFIVAPDEVVAGKRAMRRTGVGMEVFVVGLEQANAKVAAEVPVKAAPAAHHRAPGIRLVIRAVHIRAARIAVHERSEVNARPAINQTAFEREYAAVAGTGERESGVGKQIVLRGLYLNSDVAIEKIRRALNHAGFLNFERNRKHRTIGLDGIKGSSWVEHGVAHKNIPLGRGSICVALSLAG